MMISQRQSKPHLRPDPSAGPGLSALAAAVRAVVAEHADWRDTARLAASALERHLPSPSVLTAEQRTEDPDTYKSEMLHAEPDGSFSIVAQVLLPGQVTPIHDHVTWCVFGVIQGMEREELRPPSATVVSGRVSRTLGHGGADRGLPRSRGNLLCIQELR